MRTTSATPGWELRYSWQPDQGVTHPTRSSEQRGGDREAVEAYAVARWERSEQGLTMTAVELRQLPDGEWEPLLPIEASCEVRPRGYISEPEAVET